MRLHGVFTYADGKIQAFAGTSAPLPASYE
jgi:hypothetical protein